MERYYSLKSNVYLLLAQVYHPAIQMSPYTTLYQTPKGADLSTLCFFLTNMTYKTRQDRSIATMFMGDETAF